MSANTKLKLAVIGSGKGSNLASIVAACASGSVNAEVVIVVSDQKDAGILQEAEVAGLDSFYLEPGGYRTKLDEAAEQRLVEKLTESKADLVVLAGFMRILKGEFLRAFANRVINIHPSLLPSFPGLQAWKQALDYGVKVTGCTVHMVDQGIDTGRILAQTPVLIEHGDTAELLHARIQTAEHHLYPEVIADIADGRISIDSGQKK